MQSVRCRDAYEAQKLLGLASSKDGAPPALAGVINVIEEECILVARDSAAHSVTLHDIGNAALLADFVQSVHEGVHSIVSAKADGDTVMLEKR